jgi:carboxylate-amine ligase
MLPRQGVPPAIDSWAQFADDLAWGEASGSVPEIRQWWWELRPHVGFGTLEVRVCDTQVETADSAAIAALVHCLVAWLAARYDGGETLERVPTWRIAENRWAACRDGVEGELADLHTGVRRPTVEWLRALIETLRPLGEQLDCAAELDATTRLLDQNGALRQREVVRQLGVGALSAWLAERFPS